MVCTWCCIRCRPRYKRHVDSIFPVDPKAGLVNVEMQKLTYYALTNPRKLDRIGNYLADYLRYYVDHRRNDFAAISMRAMEQLLQACRSANINLFVESFLRMVQKLLESPEPSLQILGSTSFVLFANIQEDTPSYHRRYDFFVSKFSSMSQGGGQGEISRRTRQAGLKGLQGVIVKTVTDDTMVNIWDDKYLQKIMQALLFNIHRGFSTAEDQGGSCPSPWEGGEQSSDIDPDQLARFVLQDLVSRAAYGHVKSLMKPLLHFIDNHRLWVPNAFPLHCMRLIMGSIRMQNSFIAVTQLLGHLEEHKDGAAKLRVSLVEVVSQSVTLASAESITPTILEMFGSLLRRLKESISTCNKQGAAVEDVREEGEYQDAIVQSVENFTRALQTYTKVEVCTHIIGSIPTFIMTEEDEQIERIYLQCIMKITQSLNSTLDTITLPLLFPGSFLAPLQALALSPSPTTRAVSQQIYHTVLDRAGNRAKLLPSVELGELSEEGITLGVQKNQDVLFFKQRGQEIYFRVFEGLLKEDNNLDNYSRTFCTALLWCIEIPSDEVLVEMVHMVFGLQDEACSNPRSNVNVLHALVAAFLVFASRLSQNDAFYQHVSEVNTRRKADKPHLLPTVALSSIDEDGEGPAEVEEGLGPYMFDATVVAECLKQQGTNVERLSDPYHYKRAAVPRTPESIHSLKLNATSDGVIASEIQTCPIEEVTYDSLKQALQNSQKLGAVVNGSKERLLSQESYEECMAKSNEKRSQMMALRQQVFGSFRNGDRDVSPTESTHSLIDLDNLNNLSIELPDMYVY